MTQPADSAAGKKATVQERIDAALTRFNRSDEPGLVAAVSLAGKTIYRRGFGLASVEQGVANRPSTRMRIGSTSKHFACLAVMLLAEEGKLDIDASVRTVIPELPVGVGEPTLRQFMTHTSGLRDFLDVSFLLDGFSVKPAGYPLHLQVQLDRMNFPAGEKAIYNNGGYHLLSVVVDRVAGMPLEEFVARRIFEPLGMKDTSWAGSDLDVHPGMASLHLPRPGGGWRKGLFPNEDVRAEGGMVSTVDDMLRWLAHMRAGAKVVGSAASWAQMTTPTRLASGSVVPYAFGLMTGTYRGLDVVHHGGSVIGGGCQMLTVPGRELDIVVLTNGALVSPGDLAETLIDCVLDGEELKPRAANAPVAPFRALVGKTYRSTTSDFVVRFEEAGENIAACVFNNPPIPLVDKGGDLHVPFDKVVTGPFVFRTSQLKRLAEEAPEEMTLLEGGLTEKLSRVGEAPTELQEDLVGRYAVPELDATAEVRAVDGKLQLHVQGRHGHGLFILTPVARDAFLCEFGIGNFPLRATLTVQRKGGAVAALSYSSLRSRGIMIVRP